MMMVMMILMMMMVVVVVGVVIQSMAQEHTGYIYEYRDSVE